MIILPSRELILPRPRRCDLIQHSLLMGGGNNVSNSDPFWSSVVLLLKMDGANGSTTFTDSSSYSRTPSKKQNVALSNAHSKFGVTSGHATNGLTGANQAILEYASADAFAKQMPWTLDFWIYMENIPGTQPYFLARNSGSYCIISTSNGILVATGILPGAVGSAPCSLNIWHHIAFVADVYGNSKTFLDGVQQGPTSPGSLTTTAQPFGIFSVPGRTDLYSLDTGCYLNDVRITLAERYTGNFTPPTHSAPTQ